MILSLIIVNYNVKFYLEQCLISVLRACENIESEIIVVDITVGAKTALSDGIRIINANGQVNITGAKAGQLIEVCNAAGSRISSTIATDGDNKLKCLSAKCPIINFGFKFWRIRHSC